MLVMMIFFFQLRSHFYYRSSLIVLLIFRLSFYLKKYFFYVWKNKFHFLLKFYVSCFFFCLVVNLFKSSMVKFLRLVASCLRHRMNERARVASSGAVERVLTRVELKWKWSESHGWAKYLCRESGRLSERLSACNLIVRRHRQCYFFLFFFNFHRLQRFCSHRETHKTLEKISSLTYFIRSLLIFVFIFIFHSHKAHRFIRWCDDRIENIFHIVSTYCNYLPQQLLCFFVFVLFIKI